MIATLTAQQEAAALADAVRRARTGVRTRQILQAAAQLIARDGSDAVSMQAIAGEAEVSVGLIYRYFESKQDLVQAIIVQVLEAANRRVPAAIAAAGADPLRQLVAGFDAYCRVIADHRHAAVLTYRESKSLSDDRQSQLKALESATTRPLIEAAQRAVAAGAGAPLDERLFAYDLVLLAHAWALKHWYFEQDHTLDEYIAAQTTLMLRCLTLVDPHPSDPDPRPRDEAVPPTTEIGAH